MAHVIRFDLNNITSYKYLLKNMNHWQCCQHFELTTHLVNMSLNNWVQKIYFCIKDIASKDWNLKIHLTGKEKIITVIVHMKQDNLQSESVSCKFFVFLSYDINRYFIWWIKTFFWEGCTWFPWTNRILSEQQGSPYWPQHTNDTRMQNFECVNRVSYTSTRT